VIAEEDEVRYVVGEVFVNLSSDDAEQRLQQYQEETQAEVKRLGSELQDISSQMDSLKKLLYSKLGNSINLEEE
jgi:prefoldin subunit 4